MKVLPFLTLGFLVALNGCAHRWVFLTELETTSGEEARLHAICAIVEAGGGI